MVIVRNGCPSANVAHHLRSSFTGDKQLPLVGKTAFGELFDLRDVYQSLIKSRYDLNATDFQTLEVQVEHLIYRINHDIDDGDNPVGHLLYKSGNRVVVQLPCGVR